MDYITTTDLRTKSSRLITTLKQGGKVSLIHRSKVVGIIQPVPETAKPFDAKVFDQLTAGLNLPKLSPSQREKIYRKHLVEKYGKNLP